MYDLKASIRSAALTVMASSSFLFAAACNNCGAPADPPPPDGPPGPKVTDATVRSCDILLQLAGDEVPAVDFDNSVRGQSIPQAPRLAISFAARADAALTGASPFTLRFKGAASTVTLVSETCFDNTGKAIEGTPVVLP